MQMRNSPEQSQVKIQEPDYQLEVSPNNLRSTLFQNHPFYNQQQLFTHKRDVNNSPFLIRRRRNSSFRLKNEPTDEKMRKIDEKRGNYKRSTNNSHKKYTGMARRLLLKYLSEEEINRFETVYQSLKNSRTYYFIILAHIKFLLPEVNKQEFLHQFTILMNNKIQFYRKEIEKTHNRNFIHFRHGEIAEIQFALRALKLYFLDYVDRAVEIIYKKDKSIIIKKTQYEQTVKIIKNLQANLKERSKKQANNVYHKSMRKRPNQQDQDDFSEPFQREDEESGSRMQVQGEDYIPQQNHQEQSSSKKSQNYQQLKAYSQKSTHVFPLRHLENSYPIFECFYPIIFPYEEGCFNSGGSLSLIHSQMQFQLLEQEISHQDLFELQKTVTKFQSIREVPFIITPRQQFQEQSEL